MLIVAVPLALSVIFLAPRTRPRGLRRPLFLALVLLLDGLAVLEACGPEGSRTAAAAVLLGTALPLTLTGFVYWWRAVERLDARPPIDVVAWLTDVDPSQAPPVESRT
jgi:hypothetical protein